MNNPRRKEIAELVKRARELADLMSTLKDDIEAVKDDESEYYDNMPDSLQMSDRGLKAEEAVGQLDSAVYELENIDFDSLVSSLEMAAE